MIAMQINVQPVVPFFTFRKLDGEVINAIAKFWVVEERLAYEKVCRLVGKCCKSLWEQEEKLLKRLLRDAFEKYYFRCPNLKQVDVDVSVGIFKIMEKL